LTNLGILVSGGGTNLQAILDRIEQGGLPLCKAAVVVSSRADAYALERARLAGVPAVCVPRKRCRGLAEFDARLLEALARHAVDLVVMAGFLTIVGAGFVDAYPYRIVNTHPALIPSFCGKGFYGLEPHRAALAYGVRVTGATTHFVTLGADEGPIILQKAVPVLPGDTPETLQRRVMEQAEWKILPESIRLFSEGRLRVAAGGRRVEILPGADGAPYDPSAN